MKKILVSLLAALMLAANLPLLSFAEGEPLPPPPPPTTDQGEEGEGEQTPPPPPEEEKPPIAQDHINGPAEEN